MLSGFAFPTESQLLFASSHSSLHRIFIRRSPTNCSAPMTFIHVQSEIVFINFSYSVPDRDLEGQGRASPQPILVNGPITTHVTTHVASANPLVLWMAGGPRGDGITTGTTWIRQVQPGSRKSATRYAGRPARGTAAPGCGDHRDRDGKHNPTPHPPPDESFRKLENATNSVSLPTSSRTVLTLILGNG